MVSYLDEHCNLKRRDDSWDTGGVQRTPPNRVKIMAVILVWSLN